MTKRPEQPLPTVAIALMTAFILCSGFFGLLVIVIPGAVQMLLAGLLLTGFFVAQYFVWGRWMYQYVVRKEAEARQREQHRAGSSSSLPAATAVPIVTPNE